MYLSFWDCKYFLYLQKYIISIKFIEYHAMFLYTIRGKFSHVSETPADEKGKDSRNVKKNDKNNGKSSMAAGLAGAGIMIVLAGGLIAVSGPLYKSIAGRNLPVSDEPIYNEGTYEGSARGYGGPITVTARFSEYGIEDVRVAAPDETPEIGKAAAVKLSKDIWMKQTHSVDSVSGATMTSNAVKTAMASCVRGAVKEGTELAAIIEQEIAQENAEKALPAVEELLKEVADGAYVYRDAEPDENGFYNEIKIEISQNKITQLVWDAVQTDGTGKREMSEAGQYTMTENGPKWYEQADELARYVMENQTTEGLMNDGGTSDAVSSVSIHIGGFIDCLKKCLLLAKGDTSHMSLDALLAQASDGEYSWKSGQADDNGFCDAIFMTVKDHKITDLKWDAVNAEGAGKRQLSEAGQYTMTENGPKWYEQADTLAGYLVKNQTEKGLLSESGYAGDAVSSVSIYAGGFLEAVKQCLLNGPVL